jgi:hypothetical protein
LAPTARIGEALRLFAAVNLADLGERVGIDVVARDDRDLEVQR